MIKGKKILAAAIIIVLIAAGVLIYFFVFKPKTTMQLEKIIPHAEALYGRAITLKPDKESALTVYNADKVGMTLNVPAGAVEKETKITVFPAKIEKGVPEGLMILPDNVSFKKPVELLFDFNLSKEKNNAGQAQVYQYGFYSLTLTPQLVDHPLETELYLPAKIFASGTYFFTEARVKNENKLMHDALNLKNPTTFTVMAGASDLLSNKQKISPEEKSIAQNSVNKILSLKDPSPAELYAALNLKNLLQNAKISGFFPQAQAGDLYAGYLLERCNDQSLSPDEILSAWKTAQALGYNDTAKNCEQRYKNIVADSVNKLLDKGLESVTYAELKRALREVQFLDLGTFEEAITKKMRDKAVKEGTDILRATNVDPGIITIALQNVQRYAPDDTGLASQLEEKLRNALGKDVSEVLGNENAVSDDIVSALAKDQMSGGANQAQLKEQLAKAVAREAANAKADPNTSQEKYTELGRRAEMAGNENLAREMYDRAGNAPKEKKTQPDTSGDDELPDGDFAFDMNALTVPLLSLFGLTDFSSEGVEKLKEQKLQEFAEMREMIVGLCAAIEALGGGSDCEQKIIEYDRLVDQFGIESDKAIGELIDLEAQPPEEEDDRWDGSNDNSLTGECIPEEVADEIDPDHSTYTICPSDDNDESDGGVTEVPAIEETDIAPSEDSTPEAENENDDNGEE